MYTDLHTNAVIGTRLEVCKTTKNAPEEPTHTSRAETRDVDLSEHGLPQINRSHIVSIRRAHKPRQIYMSILPQYEKTISPEKAGGARDIR